MNLQLVKTGFILCLIGSFFGITRAQSPDVKISQGNLPKIIYAESPVLYFHHKAEIAADSVTIDIEIDTLGNVSRARWVMNECYRPDEIKEAVKKWRFAPAENPVEKRCLRLVVSHTKISRHKQDLTLEVAPYNINLKATIARFKEYRHIMPPSVIVTIGEITRKS